MASIAINGLGRIGRAALKIPLGSIADVTAVTARPVTRGGQRRVPGRGPYPDLAVKVP